MQIHLRGFVFPRRDKNPNFWYASIPTFCSRLAGAAFGPIGLEANVTSQMVMTPSHAYEYGEVRSSQKAAQWRSLPAPRCIIQSSPLVRRTSGPHPLLATKVTPSPLLESPSAIVFVRTPWEQVGLTKLTTPHCWLKHP